MPGQYVTPSRLRRLGRDKQVAYMAHWFHGMFEDPAHETPYNGREGGYQYIWGGPYNARDELYEEFGSFMPERVIEAAVDEVEREGTLDWAPGPNHPDQQARHDEALADDYESQIPSLDEIRQRLEDGVQPRFGDPLEVDARQELTSMIADARKRLERCEAPAPRIGHNNPPEGMALPIEREDDLISTFKGMESELRKPEPDVHSIIYFTDRLQKAAEWIGKKVDIAVDSFVKAAFGAAGVGAAAELAGLPLKEKLGEVVTAALKWLNIATLPF